MGVLKSNNTIATFGWFFKEAPKRNQSVWIRFQFIREPIICASQNAESTRPMVGFLLVFGFPICQRKAFPGQFKTKLNTRQFHRRHVLTDQNSACQLFDVQLEHAVSGEQHLTTCIKLAVKIRLPHSQLSSCPQPKILLNVKQLQERSREG